MHIKIWSDIRCPFCYIGKKHFEAALNSFPEKEKITVEWKSFELDPNLKTTTTTDALTHFVDSKGIDRERAKHMFNNVTSMAANTGLDFNLENSIPANSFNAHRLLHFAKQEGLAHKTKEALLQAHLTEGKNIDDHTVLLDLSKSIGLDTFKVKHMLESDDFAYEVRQDEMEARNLGINSVPFFVLDNKYGVSGAQPVEVFKQALQDAWEKHQSKLTIVANDNSCDINGNCN
ncbi:DsbA family oxidoreductase [Aestuariibaculum suncheonense]|uniref:DsbA family oxidoreductase n=1 Tax=Aestuariibaculum suncheonense TaxID=1028745 RepID=A0A8J6QGQ0_9FLAO|nr:DsbA family oxidoreductase [Aestuariibaculum suncheonense]MBD0835191.1 DsbA family oxidoreductase [Aestuariibaculum suncheonense]